MWAVAVVVAVMFRLHTTAKKTCWRVPPPMPTADLSNIRRDEQLCGVAAVGAEVSLSADDGGSHWGRNSRPLVHRPRTIMGALGGPEVKGGLNMNMMLLSPKRSPRSLLFREGRADEAWRRDVPPSMRPDPPSLFGFVRRRGRRDVAAPFEYEAIRRRTEVYS